MLRNHLQRIILNTKTKTTANLRTMNSTSPHLLPFDRQQQHTSTGTTATSTKDQSHLNRSDLGTASPSASSGSSISHDKKPLLVLDVNGILCHRYRKREIPQDILAAVQNSSLEELFPTEQQHPNQKDGEHHQKSNSPSTTNNINIRHYLYRDSIANIAKTPIIPRSDVEKFLRLLDAHFTLAVWTSGESYKV